VVLYNILPPFFFSLHFYQLLVLLLVGAIGSGSFFSFFPFPFFPFFFFSFSDSLDAFLGFLVIKHDSGVFILFSATAEPTT